MTQFAARRFTTPVDREAVADLRRRLGQTRWPQAETVDDWSQGTPLSFLRELCEHWESTYDWAERAARLDRFDQFTVDIDGLGIHFIHARSPEPDALPLLVTHGWPGSIVEFQDVIGPLSDPAAHGGDAADAFHVICPSLPGYGWSDAPTAPGVGIPQIARMWAQLMAGLGYDRYGAQGGDWGAMVTTALGSLDAEHLVGIHLNMPLAFPTSEPETETERQVVADFTEFMNDGSGYQKLQSTRPQTVGYGLVDSPAALAGWIVEKLWSWSDHDGDLTKVLTFDQILDNVMLYWLTGAGATSARLYWEGAQGLGLGPVEVPVGCSIFPREMMRTSRRWAEDAFNDLQYFSEPERGGHFAAFEQPEIFVSEVRASFRTMRGGSHA